MTRRVLRATVRWAIIWVLSTLLLSLAMRQIADARGVDVAWGELAAPSAVYALTWIALLIPMIAVARRVAMRWRTPVAALARPLLALLATPLQLSLYFALVSVLPIAALQSATWPEGGAVFYLGRFYEGLALSLIVFVADGIMERSREEHAREVREARLATQLSNAQLSALGMELQPHFLFNTLNAIASLVHSDPNAADRMIARLSTLLRRTLDAGREPLATLEEELSLLELYLDIQRVRFGDRLQVRIDVADDARGAQVPRLLLQPLVENAMQHGLAPKLGRVSLDVQAQRVDMTLHLEVRDDGVGLAPSIQEGTGLTNTRARLQQLYSQHHRIELATQPSGGTRVHLAFPFSDG